MTTPPLPQFPNPQTLLSAALRRYQTFDPDGPDTDHLCETTREVNGAQGWSASIRLLAPRRTTHAILPVTKPLMDWWQDVVADSVHRCLPPPESLRNPPPDTHAAWTHTTTLRRFQAAGDIVFPGVLWTSIHMTITVAYDGVTTSSDFTWPFDPAPIGEILANAISAALGTLPPRAADKTTQGFDLYLTHPEGTHLPPDRVFQYFSQDAPARQSQPEPEPWNPRTQTIPQGICQGRNCSYPPAPTAEHPSGCDIAWRRYAQALAKAFTDANPGIEFRTASPNCIIEVADPTHVCTMDCRYGLRDHPLDHDELCRLPDGRTFILSHPYPQGRDNPFTANLEKWRAHVPDLDIRPAGTSRSWYFPNASVLVALGQRSTLDQLNLAYTIPHGDEPFGCARWTGPREDSQHERTEG